MVAYPSQFQHHRGGEAVPGGRKRGPRLQRPPEPRSRRAGGSVDLRRQDTRPAKLHGRAAREAEPPRARYHRDLRRSAYCRFSTATVKGGSTINRSSRDSGALRPGLNYAP